MRTPQPPAICYLFDKLIFQLITYIINTTASSKDLGDLFLLFCNFPTVVFNTKGQLFFGLFLMQ